MSLACVAYNKLTCWYCQTITTVTTATAVISTHVHKITITCLLIPRTCCTSSNTSISAHSQHSLLIRSTVHIPEPSQTHCTYLCVFPTLEFLFLHRSSRSPCVSCKYSKGLLPLAKPSGSWLIVYHSPLITSWLSPLSPSINTLVWPLTSVSPSLCRDTYHISSLSECCQLHVDAVHISEWCLWAMFPLIFFLAEQNFSLLGRHFGHLSKSILYTLYSTHTKKCVTFNFNVLFIFDSILDVTKWCTF